MNNKYSNKIRALRIDQRLDCHMSFQLPICSQMPTLSISSSTTSSFPVTHYCQLHGMLLFSFKFELPSILKLVELNGGLCLQIQNDFIYSTQTDVLSLTHELPLIPYSDIVWLYHLPTHCYRTNTIDKKYSPYFSYQKLRRLNDSNIIINDKHIFFPLYFDGEHIRIYGFKSVIIPFDIVIPTTVTKGNVFTYATDFITIDEDKHNDFNNCLNILLSPSIAPAIKTVIISRLAKYNISNGKNIYPQSIDLTQYYDDEGNLVCPVGDTYNLTHRTIFSIWRHVGITSLMKYLRSIDDSGFQTALRRFNKLQHK